MIDLEWVQIAIANTGLGITESIQKQIFNPFFTTKPIGKGTGMGMAISYQMIAEKHGGKLTCFSTLGTWAEFVIHIPIKNQEGIGHRVYFTTLENRSIMIWYSKSLPFHPSPTIGQIFSKSPVLHPFRVSQNDDVHPQ